MIVAWNALSVRPEIVDGAATYSLNVLRQLPAALPGARVVAYVRRGERRLDGVDGLELRSVDVRGPLHRILRETVALGSDLRRLGADVLVSPNESLPLSLPCPAIVVAQNLVWHHVSEGLRHEPLGFRVRAAYYRRRMPAAFARAAAVVAVSHETLRVVRERADLDPAKAHVVLEGADSFLLPGPVGASPPRQLRLLVVGATSPYKNLSETLALFARVSETRRDLTLEIVGGDPFAMRSRLTAEAAAAGLDGRVRFRGDVPPEELVRLYATSLLLLHLSSCESFGLPLVEAMRFGLPVVAAERSSLPEVAGGAALLVDPFSVEASAAAVARLVDDDSARAELAARGVCRAAELTWRATADGVADVVRAVTGDPSGERWSRGRS